MMELHHIFKDRNRDTSSQENKLTKERKDPDK